MDTNDTQPEEVETVPGPACEQRETLDREIDNELDRIQSKLAYLNRRDGTTT